ncbi:MAG: peptide chain release factor N(5)-glutamine methyltransferase, partial [Spirochaetaceae bacterium]|nr:peptide chain release factor N(5)-glutamine methyltransferase [Spirochaetaceae bacterium]
SLLLAHSRGISREKLYMELGETCTAQVLESYRTALERRLSGEPVAWIIGIKEFWGMGFQVGPGVLCPRPDSEILVEAALKSMDEAEILGIQSNGVPRLHDCCCGPGTLGIALGVERPNWEVSASDISPQAEEYFRINNQNLAGGRLTYHQSDLMEGIPGPFDIIVSNPPYLTPAETKERTELGWREPVLALDGGGTDGLDVIRRLIPRIFNRLIPGGTLLLEADPLQMPYIRQILASNDFVEVNVHQDLAGHERAITAKRKN